MMQCRYPPIVDDWWTRQRLALFRMASWPVETGLSQGLINFPSPASDSMVLPSGAMVARDPPNERKPGQGLGFESLLGNILFCCGTMVVKKWHSEEVGVTVTWDIVFLSF